MGERHFITDVDTDAGKPGEESLARLVSDRGGEGMPATLTYQTGGGGRQYITLIPEGVEVRSSNGKLAGGIDIKGVRSYGILPPSVSGKGPYTSIADRSLTCRRPPGWRTGSASSTASAPSASACSRRTATSARSPWTD